MNRRAFTFIELILAIGITAVIGVSIATMMAAVSSGITSQDDGRHTAIRIATTKLRLGAYVAPSRCILDKDSSFITLWLEDSEESNTVHATEIRWIQFNNESNELEVKFVSFPENWTQSQVDAANQEYGLNTNYSQVLQTFEENSFIETIGIADSVESCNFWTNEPLPLDATQVSMRFSLVSAFGETRHALIDETIRLHQFPMEQQ